MNVGIIGAGNMARSIVVGLGVPVGVTDGGSGRAQELAALVGGTAIDSNAELATQSEILLLCHKPEQLDAVAAEIASYDGILVSVLAATPVDRLEAAFADAQVVRIMPNTPVEVRRGVVCISTGGAASSEARERVTKLLTPLGTIVSVTEDEIELATAIGGCAPAFYALFAEELAIAAAARGMDPALARQIAGETLAGSGALLVARAYDTERVQGEVASPGGLTEKALHSFDEYGLAEVVERAVDAALGKD